MATRYHINPETGRANICRAKIKCDFAVDGVEPQHFENKKAAQQFHQKELADEAKKNGTQFNTKTKSASSKKEIKTQSKRARLVDMVKEPSVVTVPQIIIPPKPTVLPKLQKDIVIAEEEPEYVIDTTPIVNENNNNEVEHKLGLVARLFGKKTKSEPTTIQKRVSAIDKKYKDINTLKSILNNLSNASKNPYASEYSIKDYQKINKIILSNRTFEDMKKDLKIAISDRLHKEARLGVDNPKFTVLPELKVVRDFHNIPIVQLNANKHYSGRYGLSYTPAEGEYLVTDIDFKKYENEFVKLEEIDNKSKSLQSKLEKYKTMVGDNPDPEIVKTAETRIENGAKKAQAILKAIRKDMKETEARDLEWKKEDMKEKSTEEGLGLFNESLNADF